MWQTYFYGDQMENEMIIPTDYPQEWLDKALSITGKFEGSGYDNVTGNFDGQGISAGILQWNIGQGSLQSKILKPYLLKHGSIDKLEIFPDKIMDMLAKSTPQSGIRLTVVHMHLAKRNKLAPTWIKAWKKFLTMPEVIELQKLACDSVADQAIHYCKQWDMLTQRAFCWFFDLVTQNGGLKGVTKPIVDQLKLINAIRFASPKNEDLWSRKTISAEQVTLMIASFERAILSRAAYQKDVMDRKGTIAIGIGYVHGEKFDTST
jgi:hypothetical protein